MSVNVGINGLGRIGRQVLRILRDWYPQDLRVTAVNDIGDPEILVELLRHDSNYGASPETVELHDAKLTIGEDELTFHGEPDPGAIPWEDQGVQIVIESSGAFTHGHEAAGHLNGSVKKVIITANADEPDVTVVYGVNNDMYDPANHSVIAGASCTTNCLAPVAKVLVDEFGIRKSLMTTVHSYTSSQALLDTPKSKVRRSRAAPLNIVPTTTGAAEATTLAVPELKDRFDGMALRVPTPTVSISDLVALVERETTVEEVNAAFKKAAAGTLKGVLDYSDQPLVSMDYKGTRFSAIVDGLSTMVEDGDLVKVLAWYDNEWGYSCRVADLTKMVADRGL